MSIALFDEAYRVSINNAEVAGGSRVGLLLGMTTDPKGALVGIVLLEDGSVTRIHATYFTVDFRYDVESDRWIDQGAPAGDQEG